MSAPVTIAEVRLLGALAEAVRNGGRIRILDEDYNVFTGVLRHFTEADGQAAHADWLGGDIRDKFVRVSATFEHWFPVSQLIDGMREGKVFVG